MIELFILLQLIQVLTPGSNLINLYQDQKEVGVRTSISHKLGMIRNFQLKMGEKHMESLYSKLRIKRNPGDHYSKFVIAIFRYMHLDAKSRF